MLAPLRGKEANNFHLSEPDVYLLHQTSRGRLVLSCSLGFPKQFQTHKSSEDTICPAMRAERLRLQDPEEFGVCRCCLSLLMGSSCTSKAAVDGAVSKGHLGTARKTQEKSSSQHGDTAKTPHGYPRKLYGTTTGYLPKILPHKHSENLKHLLPETSLSGHYLLLT